LRCVLSTMQSPSDFDLQTYCRLRRIERLKNPAQPSHAYIP
jgi:hypothetical protein